MFGDMMQHTAMEVSQRILHIDPDFLMRQQEAARKAREAELRMRQAMQFSAPGEPGGAIQGAGSEAAEARPVQRPMAGPLPGTVVNSPAGAPRGLPMQNPADIFKNVGRNDPCPCGSGKKFKKCHGQES